VTSKAGMYKISVTLNGGGKNFLVGQPKASKQNRGGM
jgi:hypothetical protein